MNFNDMVKTQRERNIYKSELDFEDEVYKIADELPRTVTLAEKVFEFDNADSGYITYTCDEGYSFEINFDTNLMTANIAFYKYNADNDEWDDIGNTSYIRGDSLESIYMFDVHF